MTFQHYLPIWTAFGRMRLLGFPKNRPIILKGLQKQIKLHISHLWDFTTISLKSSKNLAYILLKYKATDKVQFEILKTEII
jgi:hypothetical protein